TPADHASVTRRRMTGFLLLNLGALATAVAIAHASGPARVARPRARTIRELDATLTPALSLAEGEGVDRVPSPPPGEGLRVRGRGQCDEPVQQSCRLGLAIIAGYLVLIHSLLLGAGLLGRLTIAGLAVLLGAALVIALGFAWRPCHRAASAPEAPALTP